MKSPSRQSSYSLTRKVHREAGDKVPIHQTEGSRVRLREFDATVGLDRESTKAKEAIWYLIKMWIFLSAFPYPSGLKITLLRWFGARVGERVLIKPRVNIHMPWKLEIGDDVWVGEEVFILNFERVTIGDNVSISQRAFLCCGNHDYKIPSMPYRNAPITLEDGSWVGASCIIGPGVTVGIDSVITAGSVVTSDLEPNGIYAGNPAIFKGPRWKVASEL